MKRGLFGSYPRMHRLDRTVYSRRARGVFAGSEDPERGVEGMQTLAESTERLSEEFKSRHPQIPWRNIAGFRNILVHDYLGIKLQRIWEIIEVDLRLLKATLNQAIGEKKNKKI